MRQPHGPCSRGCETGEGWGRHMCSLLASQGTPGAQVGGRGSFSFPSQQGCASPPPLQAPWGSCRSRGLICCAGKAGGEGGSDAKGISSGASGGADGADWGRGQPPGPLELPVEGSPALLQQCIERARGVVKVIEGRQFVPLEEASLSRNSALSTSAAARTNLLA